MAHKPGIDRDALYEEVWKAPMLKVGEKYGLSRPTIKWACIQMGIPLPPQSYWTHLAHGLKIVAQPALPQRRQDQPQTISRAELVKQEPPSCRKGNPLQRARWSEERERIREEDIKRAELMEEVDGWHRAESIRRYLGELDRRIAADGMPTEGYAEWRAWAERCAADLDYSSSRVEFDGGRFEL